MEGRADPAYYNQGLAITMCNNDQNDSYLDSLVDSYAASQDSVEKKLETFAQSRQISQRIARARLNEVDFNNKYRRSKKEDEGEEEPLITIINSQEEDEELPEETHKEITKTVFAPKPDFVGTSPIPTLTKPLDDLKEISQSEQASFSQRASMPLPNEESKSGPDGLTMEFDPSAASEISEASTQTRPFTPNSTNSLNDTPEATISTPPFQHELERNSQSNPNSSQNSIPRQSLQEQGSMTSTRVFNTPNGAGNGRVDHPANLGNTISVTPGSLPKAVSSSNSDSSQGVQLKRQYVNPEGKTILSDEERRPHKTNSSSIYLTIGAIVAALVVLIVGGVIVKNYIEDTFRTSQNSSAYDELLAWAIDYPTYNEKQQKTITQWRVTFEKCTTEQKEKINDVLVSGTGKTFDELLAAAVASQNKDNSISNENVAKAEKKAKLKDDIAILQNEISNLQTQLNGVNGRIMDAEANYNNKNAAYMAAENKVQSCQNTLDTLNIQLSSLPDETALQNQLSTLKAQLSVTSPTIVLGGNDSDSQDDDSITSPPIAVPGAPSGVNNSNNNTTSMAGTDDLGTTHPIGRAEESLDQDATHSIGRHYETSGTIVANPEYQELQQEISELEAKIQSTSSERFSLQVQISDAEAALSEAQAALPVAKSEADAAYGAWQALKNEAEPIQKQIDEKNAKLAELQDELNSIQ